MIVRITHGLQETWHRDVVRARGDNGYLRLWLAGHPYQVNWFGAAALVCETEADVADALYDERLEREWNATAMDEVRR